MQLAKLLPYGRGGGGECSCPRAPDRGVGWVGGKQPNTPGVTSRRPISRWKSSPKRCSSVFSIWWRFPLADITSVRQELYPKSDDCRDVKASLLRSKRTWCDRLWSVTVTPTWCFIVEDNKLLLSLPPSMAWRHHSPQDVFERIFRAFEQMTQEQASRLHFYDSTQDSAGLNIAYFVYSLVPSTVVK